MGAIKLLLPSDFKASKPKLVPHLFQKSRSSWRCSSHWTTDWPAGCRFGQAKSHDGTRSVWPFPQLPGRLGWFQMFPQKKS